MCLMNTGEPTKTSKQVTFPFSVTVLRISKNTITITCKKSGLIKYKANGEDKQFYLKIGGNGKDSKVKKSEYKMASHTVNKKKYTNSFHCNVNDIRKKMDIEASYHIFTNGGHVFEIEYDKSGQECNQRGLETSFFKPFCFVIDFLRVS